MFCRPIIGYFTEIGDGKTCISVLSTLIVAVTLKRHLNSNVILTLGNP